LEAWSWSAGIHDDKIYVSHLHNDYVLSYVDCIYASNGTIVWSYDSLDYTYILCSPAVYEGKIYFVESFDYDRVVCLNASTGDFIWDQYLDIRESYSIAVTNGKVIVAGLDESGEDGILYCISSETGSYIWDYDMGPTYIQYPTFPRIAVSTDGIFVTSEDVSGNTGYLHCINPSYGYPTWIKSFSGVVFGSPSVADGKVYFATLTGTMYCIDITDGEQIWIDFLGYGTISSPAIADNHVFIAELMGEIFCFGEPNAPNAPTIIGTVEGKIDNEYEYIFKSIDPQNDDVCYYIDWGDDQVEEWIGPFSSGEEVKLMHLWDEEGTYIIKAKARDTFDIESEWGTLEITMPINLKLYQTSYMFKIKDFILQIFKNFINEKTILLPHNYVNKLLYFNEIGEI